MSKLFIVADIEGCAAVASQHELGSTGWGWPEARTWMTNEVAAACQAALDNGYNEVIVADGHGNAQNIKPDGLPRKTRLVRSWPRPLLQMQGVNDPDVDACIFIGHHANAQTADAILAHTYFGGAIRDLRLNGVSASEGYFNAALAGELDKPVIMISGDGAAIDDAKTYAPSAEPCVVKDALGWRAQSAVTPQEACEMIAEATKKAIARKSQCTPFVISPPYTLDIDMTSMLAAEVFDYVPFVERTGAYSVRTHHDTMIEAMRFISFLIFFSPTGQVAL